MPFDIFSPEGELELSYGAPAPVYVPTLPDLEPVPCPNCQGAGGHEGVHTEPGNVCATCNGVGEIDVCPNCQAVPTVLEGFEVCGCTVVVFALPELLVTCETCERPAAELRDGICPACFAEGAAVIQREAEQYQAWVAEQMLV